MARKKPTRAHAPASHTQTPTIIEFILDETGSMSLNQRKPLTINGFNDFVKEQRGQDGLCLMTLTKFDSGRGQTTPYTDLDVNMVPDLRNETFIPDGGTNLKDTIISRINAVRERVSSWTVKPKVLIVVMTDGEDNRSRASDETMLQTVVNAMEMEERSFVYLGVHASAKEVAAKYGIPEGNAKRLTDSEIRSTMSDLSNATKAFRASDVTTTSTFFHAA